MIYHKLICLCYNAIVLSTIRQALRRVRAGRGVAPQPGAPDRLGRGVEHRGPGVCHNV